MSLHGAAQYRLGTLHIWPMRHTCCLHRTRSDARQLVADQESPLHEHAANVVFVQDPIVNEISSTKVRGELAQVGASFPGQPGTSSADMALLDSWTCR